MRFLMCVAEEISPNVQPVMEETEVEEDPIANLNPLSSESEAEVELEDPYSGYEQLPTEMESECVEEPTEVETTVSTEPTVSATADPLPLDDSKIQSIKDCMATFSLPPTSIPDWATSVPEDQWKSDLIARITTRKSDAV